MSGPLGWVKILFGFLSRGTQKIMGRLLIISIVIAFIFFPIQYKKWGGIIFKAFIEQFQIENIKEIQPMIDNFSKSIQR